MLKSIIIKTISIIRVKLFAFTDIYTGTFTDIYTDISVILIMEYYLFSEFFGNQLKYERTMSYPKIGGSSSI